MIKKNIAANLFGRVWSAIINLVCVPLYIRILGVESYGLIGFYTVLVASIFILEFGLGATITRSLSHTYTSQEEKDGVRDLSRTMESFFWIISIVISLVLIAIITLGKKTWVNADTISKQELITALVLMCVSIMFQFPASYYSSGLGGMERQVLQNILSSIFTTLRTVGGILLLIYVNNDVLIFFEWQLLVNVLQVISYAYFFWKAMVKGSRAPRFDIGQFKKVWQFTAGVGLTGIVTFFLSQLDKLLISRLMPMTIFAYYNVANQVAVTTRMGSSAIFVAYFPRMNKLRSEGNNKGLRDAFHQGCQVISLLVLPASFIIIFFASDLINLWTNNITIATMASNITILLVAGSILNSFAGIPYDLSLVYGWSRFGFYQNLFAAIVIVPLLVVLIIYFGAIGAGIAWLILNFGYTVISVPILLKRYLKGELSKWFIIDTGLPLLICLVLTFLSKLLIGPGLKGLVLVPVLLTIWMVITLLIALVLPSMRIHLYSFAKKYR